MSSRPEAPPRATGNTPEQREGEPIRHVSYPHLPGRLYDCPACEASCHCTPGDAECIYTGQHNGMASN
jgi:hypothetical protein